MSLRTSRPLLRGLAAALVAASFSAHSFASPTQPLPRAPQVRQLDNEGNGVGLEMTTIPKPKRISYRYALSFSTVDSAGRPFWPKGIAVDGSDNVYVTGGPLGIDKYDKTGKWVKSIGLDTGQMGGIAHPENGQLLMPLGIARNGSSLFVADTGWLQGFSTSGDYNGGSQPHIDGSDETPNLVGVAATDGVVYVTDSEHTKPALLVFYADGRPMASWGEKGQSAGQFTAPRFAAVGYKGAVAITDDLKHCVIVFTKDGKYQFEFGKQGFTANTFSGPEGIAADEQGDFFVCDQTSVKVFSFDGQYLASIGASTPPVPGQPSIQGAMCVALDNADNLYVANTDNKTVDIYQYVK